MVRFVLLLSQLAVPFLPVGLCTCPRVERTARRCSCCQAEQCRRPTPAAREQPCSEPKCPAHATVKKLEANPATIPPILPPPSIPLTGLQPDRPNAHFAGHRNADASFFPTTHLFLIYGVLLI